MTPWSCAALCLLVLGGCGTAIAPPDRPGARDAAAFIPSVHRDGARASMPLTFTDGTRARLVHPAELRLAELGLVPYGSGVLAGKSPAPGRGDAVGRDFLIARGQLGALLDSLADGPPRLLRRYAGADGRSVGLWDLGPGASNMNQLGFQFGRWAVLVYDYPPEFDGGAASMTDAERAAWSRSFSGRETARGFLRLRGDGPLRLARAGEHAGPQLSFGSPDGSRWLALYPGRCAPTRDHDRRVGGRRVSWTGRFADWCLSTSMRAQARGSRRFIGALIRGLAVTATDR